MELLKASLKTTNTIEVEILKTFYNGLTNKVYLRYNNKIEELTIKKLKKNTFYNVYTIQLDTNLDLENEYEVVIDRAMRTPLNIDRVVFDKSFDELYYYDGVLGPVYKKEYTEFYVWAPTATLVNVDIITRDEEHIIVPMSRKDKGVYYTKVEKDLELASYVYIVKTSGSLKEAFDPYAYSSTPNSVRSVIVDLDKISTQIDKTSLYDFDHFTDAIIYETSVRDFTVSADEIKHKAKFLGLTETNVKTKKGNTCGLDYLEELGITHLQIMPMYDFGSILEEEQMLFYNWGYDPVNYNVAEGSYITDVFDPYKRILEVKEMIQAINHKGIRVNMDVVYNHMFDANTSCFHKLVPLYYFRYGKDGSHSNGSFCGNDTESRHLMMRRFIVDSIKRWVTLYGVDGFRFDLMGIHDKDTMNLIRKELDKINPLIMLYGEGWHMPSIMTEGLKSSIQNQRKVPNIGMFNDRFRDTLKGPHSNLKEKGFLCGNKSKTDYAASCYTGTVLGFKDIKPYMLKPTTTINYSSCHDNYTMYDQLMKTYKDNDKARSFQTFIMSNLFVTQGIIFMNAGSEFFRTKLGEENSYNTSDEQNHIDWDKRDIEIENIERIKSLIKLRKSYKGYRLHTASLIQKYTKVNVLKKGVIEYVITYDNNEYIHLINATSKSYHKTYDTEYIEIMKDTSIHLDSVKRVNSVDVSPFTMQILKLR